MEWNTLNAAEKPQRAGHHHPDAASRTSMMICGTHNMPSQLHITVGLMPLWLHGLHAANL